MALNLFQQAQELITKAKQPLIVLPRNPSLDAVASGLGLFMVFEKLHKKSKVVCNDFRLPPNTSFLPKSTAITQDLASLRKFIISVDVSRTAVEELSYDIQNNQLQIYLTPRGGFFEEKDVTVRAGHFTHDLVITIESPDLESLGALYDDNTEFFYRTPVINLDHNPNNERYGQVNIVEVTAASTSEIVFELTKALGEGLLDEYIATHLLTGIISKTKSFQTPTVTPKSLAVASHLIASGARRDEIIKNLYQTKSLATLKLWGRALAKLQSSDNQKIVWSLLTAEDFKQSGATPDELAGVVDELIISAPMAQAVFVLFERSPRELGGVVHTPASVDGLSLLKEWSPTGTKDFTHIRLNDSELGVAEQKLLGLLRPVIR